MGQVLMPWVILGPLISGAIKGAHVNYESLHGAI